MADLFKRPGSDKWQAYCWYWSGDVRKRVPKSTGIRDDGSAKSRQTAQINADRIERSLALGGEAVARPSKTIRQALRALTEAAELAGRTRDTIDCIMYRGARLAEFFGDSKQLRDIDDDAALAYAIWARKDRVAPTVAKEFILLGQAFDNAKIERPKFPDLGDLSHKPQRVLELDEQKRFLLAVPGARRLNVCAYLLGGLRQSEPWKVVEVAWDARCMSVQGTKRKVDRRAPREVPIPDELFEMMWPRRAEWPVFPAWAPSSIAEAIKLAGQRAEICEDLSVNDLRGTYATHMARAGVPQLTLAKIMGNSVKQLDETYAQVNKRGDHLQQAAALLPRITQPKADAQLQQSKPQSKNSTKTNG